MQSQWGFIYWKRLFLTFGNLILVNLKKIVIHLLYTTESLKLDYYKKLQILVSNFVFKLVKLSHSKFYVTKKPLNFALKMSYLDVLWRKFLLQCLKPAVSNFQKCNISCKIKKL